MIYDEVHALDGNEGAALQRLIRSMTCNFLALSATVGNAEQMRGWFEVVKGDQLNIETLDVSEAEVKAARAPPPAPVGTSNENTIKIHVQRTLESNVTLDFSFSYVRQYC